MDITKFQQINAERAKRWHKGDRSQWNLLEWSGAMAGEVGEACNVAKKIRRLDLHLPNKEVGIDKGDLQLLKYKLGCEIADSIIYGCIILSELGFDSSLMIASIFNQKSVEYGFPERAPLTNEDRRK